MFDSYLITSLSKLNKRSEAESIRFILYSSYSSLLLSKKYFKKNKDIKGFLDQSNINFKSYVYLSRTQIIARVIRVIEKADDQTLYFLLRQIKKVIFEKSYSYSEKDPATEGNNYIDGLMEQFGRDELNDSND